MRPAKISHAASRSWSPEARPVWSGDATTPDGALDYLGKRALQSHTGQDARLDALALEALVREAVSTLNQNAPHHPPVARAVLGWTPVDALSGVKRVHIEFHDTQGRVHDETWAADAWCSPAGEPDRALGQWPLDDRSPRLGGGWEHWLRTLAAGLPLEGCLSVDVPLAPGADQSPMATRPTSQRKGMVPR